MSSVPQKSQFTVFEITLHLMMKHQGILCNKTQLRFIAAAVRLMIPEGNSDFYLLYHNVLHEDDKITIHVT